MYNVTVWICTAYAARRRHFAWRTASVSHGSNAVAAGASGALLEDFAFWRARLPSCNALLLDGHKDEVWVLAFAHEVTKGRVIRGQWFYATDAAGPVAKVRKLCGLPATAPGAVSLLLLDIPDDGGFYLREKVATVDVAALEAFLASPGDRKQLEAG